MKLRRSATPVVVEDPSSTSPVLRVRDLRTYLYTRWGTTRAVDGVSFDVEAGETLGIVGESGSGKSMLALSLVRLTPEPAARNVSGSVHVGGTDLLQLTERQMRSVRGRDIAMILQDPHQSLNPVFTVGDQLREALRSHNTGVNRRTANERAIQGLEDVGVPAPEGRMRNYPHELSGGMKQRIVGAMALAYDPKVLIADEPTTALDVTIQAQYLQLLKDVQVRTNVALIVITHDFGVIAQSCDRVAVMYAGRIVEHGPVDEIFDKPRHPYTRALLDSRPRSDVRMDRLATIRGQPPSLTDLPRGCRFADRCPYVVDHCRKEYPETVQTSGSHSAACWRVEEI